jgi:hypothetical protein
MSNFQGRWFEAETGDSILVSFDPVAHDTVGFQVLTQVMSAKAYDTAAATDLANPWLAASAELGLGTNDPGEMELVEVELGHGPDRDVLGTTVSFGEAPPGET